VSGDKSKGVASSGPDLTFDHLVGAIGEIHKRMAARAGRAVNVSLTLRNWLIGYYIEEYERGGADRAQYGQGLMDELETELEGKGLSGCKRRELYRYRHFYLTYSHIVGSVTPLLGPDVEGLPELADGGGDTGSAIVGSPPPQFGVPGQELVERLSFTHLAELIKIDDPLKRGFYEVECIRGGWSVRELKRQIASLYYERSGLSENKEKLAELTRATAEVRETGLAIRDPYVFEFLGLKSKEVMSESALEDSLLDKLQDFLLELGHGFCFEARQKRILIGETYNFVDLVFYHRVLKCHVLIELKVDEFQHGHIGQLNTYVSWYAKNEMTEGDNLPIGILTRRSRNQKGSRRPAKILSGTQEERNPGTGQGEVLPDLRRICSIRDYCVLAKTTPWWSTPSPAWTISSSSRSTSCSCPTRRRWNASSNARWRKCCRQTTAETRVPRGATHDPLCPVSTAPAGAHRLFGFFFWSSTPGMERVIDDLMGEAGGVTRGPYLSVKLPFESRGRADFFPDVPLPYPPHAHQTVAFERLGGRRKLSTLVATGTG